MSRFYVYELADPRTGVAFYVGKGQRNRIDAHEREARMGQKSAKCALIRVMRNIIRRRGLEWAQAIAGSTKIVLA